jgi:hypothetical protein
LIRFRFLPRVLLSDEYTVNRHGQPDQDRAPTEHEHESGYPPDIDELRINAARSSRRMLEGTPSRTGTRIERGASMA